MNIFELIKKQASDEEIIEAIKNLKNINIKDKCGRTLLHVACSFDRLEIVKFLIENGVSVNPKDKYGYTSLHLACYHGKLEIIKYLIKQGANVNIKNCHGWTPLFTACYYDRFEIVKFLVEHGADVKSEFECYFYLKNIKRIRILTKAGVCFLKHS